MSRRVLAIAAGLASLWVGGPSRAAVIANCFDLDPDIAICDDYSDTGFLEFDLLFSITADVALEIQTSAGERSDGSLTFRALIYNDTDEGPLTPVDLSRVEVRLEGGARFETVGTVRGPVFEAVPWDSPDDVTVLITPSPPLPPELNDDILEIGNVDTSVPGAVDWVIDVSQLSSANFTLRFVAVPEPGSLASAACALLGLLVLAARGHPRL